MRERVNGCHSNKFFAMATTMLNEKNNTNFTGDQENEILLNSSIYK